jgi:hypothetical protein
VATNAREENIMHLVGNSRIRIGLLASLALVAGCGGGQDDRPLTDEADAVAEQDAAITGGNLFEGNTFPYNTVVTLNGCSALKVGPKEYLSAWHCGFAVGTATVSNALSPSGGDWISTEIVGVKNHPTLLSLSANQHGFDLAVVTLRDENSIPIFPLRFWSQPDSTIGTAVGYGCDNAAGSINGGQKQWAHITSAPYPDPISNVNAFSSSGDPSLCPGDSGGPFFRVGLSGGVRRFYLSGNASLQDQVSNPHFSAWTRVSPARDWILAVAGNSPGHNDFSEGNRGTFIHVASNWCVKSALLSGGAPVLAACGMADDDRERFDVHALGNDVYEFRTAANSSNCLATKTASGVDGEILTHRVCTGSDTERWRLETVNSHPDWRRFANVQTGKCMRAFPSDLGSKLIQWTCAFDKEFFWVFTD